MKDLKFLRKPEGDKIATALYWGKQQVSDRLIIHSSKVDFAEKVLIAWTVSNYIGIMMEIAPEQAEHLLAKASEIWNGWNKVEHFTPEYFNKLRIAFEAADEETEIKLQEHLALVQVCVAHYNHFQNKAA